MLKLITGRAGTPHITSADDGDLFKNLTAQGDYVFFNDQPAVQNSSGDTLNDGVTEKSVETDVTVNINGGAFLMCSRFVRNVGETELTLPAGVDGETATKYICLNYACENDVESVSFSVESEISQTETIYDGATSYLMPLFQLAYDGNTVVITNCYATLAAVVCTENSAGITIELPVGTQEKSITFKSADGSTYSHDTKIVGGNGSSSVDFGVYDNNLSKYVFKCIGGNLFDSNTSLLEHNVLTAALSSDTTISSSQAGQTTKLTLKKLTSIGKKLSISNGGILIGADVKYILVSGNIYYYTNGEKSDNWRSVEIRKNTNGTTSALSAHAFHGESGQHYPLSPALVSVTEGDLIYLSVSAQQSDVFKAYSHGTYLTVEVVG